MGVKDSRAADLQEVDRGDAVTQGVKGLERPEMPRENWDIGWRWLTGGDPSLMCLRDAIRLAGVMVTGVLSQRPVRALVDEARRPLPGDELVPAKVQWTNGVTIRARPSEIWPWLVQMGCRRAGAYSYDSLDNGGVPSADRIIPELQHVEVGDILPWTPTADDGFIVQAVEPERALVLGEETGSFTWAFDLEPIDETSTRLLTRVRAWYKTLASRLMLGLVFHPIHFGMQRRQLLNLKQRLARRDAGVTRRGSARVFIEAAAVEHDDTAAVTSSTGTRLTALQVSRSNRRLS